MTQTHADDAAAQAAFMLPPAPEPAPVSPTPPGPAEPQESTPEPKAVDSPKEDVPEFDPQHRQLFSGLLYVGALRDTFELYGHRFTIATPTQTERLQIGQVVAPYQNTITGEIAWQTALVAAYLVDIDGTKLPEPVLNDPKEGALHDRFRWVSENLRRPVMDQIFDRCLRLDAQVDEVLSAMGKASG